MSDQAEAWEEDLDGLVVSDWDLEVDVFASRVATKLPTSWVIHA